MEEIAEDPHLFPFFFLGNDDLIFFDLSQETREGIHPVDYAGVIIAESLEDFIEGDKCWLRKTSSWGWF